MKQHRIAYLALAIALAALVVAVIQPDKGQQTTAPAKQETAYERVVRTQTLRCGYAFWEGAVMKDDTGTLHGPWVEVTKALGEATGLKIEWASEVGWGDVGAALKSGKIDAMCAGMWSSAMKAKEISFSNPAAFQGIEIFVRSDDQRFDGKLALLNQSDVKLAIIDNDNSDFIARVDFPQAQRVSVASVSATDTDLMLNVATAKADATFVSPGTWRLFERTNAGKLRRLHPGLTLRNFGLTYAVDNDDVRLLLLINAGVTELLNSGQIDHILDKADKDYPDMFIRAARTYR
jgi:ABC-type amino acid transport substrate-binding protein